MKLMTLRTRSPIHCRAAGLATLVIASATAGSVPQRAFSGTCPESEMQFVGMGAFTSSSASFDSTLSSGGSTYRVAYDLVAGTLSLYHCCFISTTYVEARDAYDVAGVLPGTAVTVTAELTADGEVFDAGGCGGTGCSGTFGASVRHGSDYQERVHSPVLFQGARLEFHDVIRLPVTIVAGQPEEIRFRYWGYRSPGGSHGSYGSGVIRFTGLDPGVSVVSCQGFAGQPTPVRRATWGAIKSIYR